MAMNKSEQKEMERLKTMLALRHYPKIEYDILPPTEHNTIVNGYHFNAYSKVVSKACTSIAFSGIGIWNKTTSQHSMNLFSSRNLAYKAMLHELSMRFARELRDVEILMEQCED